MGRLKKKARGVSNQLTAKSTATITKTPMKPLAPEVKPSSKSKSINVAKATTKPKPKNVPPPKAVQKAKNPSPSRKTTPIKANLTTTPILSLETSKLFHESVVRLIDKTTEPCPPKDYLGAVYNSRDDYVLLHEDEQHLADGIAFLAQREDGSDFVSAVTIEQFVNPRSLVFKLAANKTPKSGVVEGLDAVLKVVEEYALVGQDTEFYSAKLFSKVVELASPRLLSRLKCSKSKKRYWPRTRDNRALQLRVDTLIEDIQLQLRDRKEDLQPLYKRLEFFKQSLLAVDTCSSADLTSTLQNVVQHSFQVSHCSNHQSLESHLQSLSLTKEICSHRTVLEIDKITRYLSIPQNLLRLASRSRSRASFSRLILSICIAPPVTRPLGARFPCSVHGEVQLVIYHELHPSAFPPRVIGSSKSACFLCDLFIEKHGRFRISHAHKRLYEQWTVPLVKTEMSRSKKEKLESVFKEMNRELQRLVDTIPKRKPFYGGNGPESRTHLLLLPPGATLFSPSGSLVEEKDGVDTSGGSGLAQISEVEEPNEELEIADEIIQPEDTKEKDMTATPAAIPQPSPPILSVTSSTSSLPPSESHKLYTLASLPFSLPLTPTTLSCTLLSGQDEYIFDLSTVNLGQLHISSASRQVEKRVDIHDLDTKLETDVRPEGEERILAFSLVDRAGREVVVSIDWTPDMG